MVIIPSLPAAIANAVVVDGPCNRTPLAVILAVIGAAVELLIVRLAHVT